MNEVSLLSAAEELRGVRDLVTALLGAKARLDRTALVLAVPAPGHEVTRGAWLSAALGLVSLRRSLNGIIGVGAAAAPEPERSPSPAVPEDLLR